jgi:hypothetical protein
MADEEVIQLKRERLAFETHEYFWNVCPELGASPPHVPFFSSPENASNLRLVGGAKWIRTAGPGCSIGSGQFLPVSVSPSRLTARLKRIGEGLASDSDQSDV